MRKDNRKLLPAVLLLLCMFCAASLTEAKTAAPALDKVINADSLIIRPDTLKLQFKRVYRQYKFKNIYALPYRFVWDGANALKRLQYSHIVEYGQDFYHLSRFIYENYYTKREIWSYRDFFILSLSLKEIQTTQGGLQVRIPFSNFSTLWQKEKYLKEN